MKFTLEFDMDNDAFNPEDGNVNYAEVSRILEKVAVDVEWRDIDDIRDINGNTIGHWQINE